jgi:hypothetical protein
VPVVEDWHAKQYFWEECAFCTTFAFVYSVCYNNVHNNLFLSVNERYYGSKGPEYLPLLRRIFLISLATYFTGPLCPLITRKGEPMRRFH